MKNRRNSNRFSKVTWANLKTSTGKQASIFCLDFFLMYFCFLFIQSGYVHTESSSTTFYYTLGCLACRGKKLWHIKIRAKILPQLGDWAKIWSKVLAHHIWQNGRIGLGTWANYRAGSWARDPPFLVFFTHIQKRFKLPQVFLNFANLWNFSAYLLPCYWKSPAAPPLVWAWSRVCIWHKS